jgi:YfiH family protein
MWIDPDWPAPAPVRALATTRAGGVSQGPYRSLNLGAHVGDDPALVALNRDRLAAAASLPRAPVWLEQVHGCTVCRLNGGGMPSAAERRADAAVADVAGAVCVVLTADCLPVLLCDDDGSVVAAVHAGWRGLLDGVIEAAALRMGRPAAALMAWLGPAIGPDAFEVGDEVHRAFCGRMAAAADAFRPSAGGRWLADIYTLARQRLAAIGIERVSGGGLCTLSDAERFFSYRRDGITGRMATLVWIDAGT